MSNVKPAAGSLAAYMQSQRERVESVHSERFPLPHYPAIDVELRIVDYKREFAIGKRLEKSVRNEADRLLYLMAEVLLQATGGFYVQDQPVAGADNSWNGLCLSAYPEATELNGRQAMIRLLTPDGVGRLFREYADWRSSLGEDIADELTSDLGVTH